MVCSGERRAASTVLMIGCVLVAGCGGGGGGDSGGGGGPPPPPANRAPTAQNDLLTATTASLANLNVLANDTDADGDTLTVTIESPAEVGTASVNAGGTIAISGLPAGFRGVTRFKYRVTDPDNATSLGTAVIFVDVEPFRVIFAGDEPGQDSPEVYITNLASPQVQLTSATVGSNLRLRTFLASDNGSTVVYRQRDQSQGNLPLGLSFVRTATPATQVPIQLPAGMQLQPGGNQQLDIYVVSPDGLWIAGIAAKDPPGTFAVFMVNVANPTVVHTPSLPDTVAAESLQFSGDSQSLYFLSGGPSNGNHMELYRAAVATPDQSELMSTAAPPGHITDRVIFYWVSADQSKIVLQARRNDALGMFYVSGANPRNEIPLSPTLAADDEIVAGAVRFGAALSRVVYSISSFGPQRGSYVAEVSATPNIRPLPDGLVSSEIRPDLQAVVMTGPTPTSLVEHSIDSGQAPTLLGDTEDYFNLRYDARGDALMMQVGHEDPANNFYVTIATAVRPTFGTIQDVIPPGKAALFTNFTGVDRAIVLMGEGPQVQPSPAVQTFRMAIVNAWAPDKPVYVYGTDLITPRFSFMGGRARVVDP